jgi:4-amino-4-deoxy-L-arabinose transferase-like glycosyltransferase
MIKLLESKKVCLVIIGCVILLAGILRLYNLEADPDIRIDGDLGLFTDEGLYSLSARNLALFGKFNPNPNNQIVEAIGSPIYTYSIYFSLKVFGIDLKALRLPTILVSILILLSAYFLIKRIFGQQTGLVTLVLLALSHMFIQYNRIALLESWISLFLLLSAYAYLLGGNRRESLMVLSGIFFGCAIITKGTAYFFLPGMFIAISLGNLGQKWVRENAKALGYFLLGLALMILLNQLYLYLVIRSGLLQGSLTRGDLLSHGLALLSLGSPGEFVKSISQILISRFSVSSPIVLFSAFIYSLLFLATVRKPFSDQERATLLFVIWFFMGVFTLSLISYQPNRYRVPLVIPTCSLTAIALTQLFDPRTKTMIFTRNRLWWLVVMGGILLIVFRTLRVTVVGLDLAFENNLILIISGVISVMLVYWLWRWKMGIRILKPNAMKLLSILLLLISLSYDGFQYWRWASNPVYNIAVGNRKIKQMVTSGVIGGQYAPTLGFSSSNILIPLHKKINQEGLQELNLTHYLDTVSHKPNNDYLELKMRNPEFLQEAQLLGEFPIGFTVASLYVISKAD